VINVVTDGEIDLVLFKKTYSVWHFYRLFDISIVYALNHCIAKHRNWS